MTVRPAFSGGFLLVYWEESAEFHLAHWVGQRTEGQIETTWVRANEPNRHAFVDLEPGTRYFFRVAAVSADSSGLQMSDWVSAVAPTSRQVAPPFAGRYTQSATPGRAAVTGIAVDGSATLAISCLRIPGAQDRIVRGIAIHWQEHDYAPLLDQQQGFERFGLMPWERVNWLVVLEGGHSLQRFGDPDEFVRRLVAGRVYVAAQPNGQDAVFLATGLAELLTTHRALAHCGWAGVLEQPEQ